MSVRRRFTAVCAGVLAVALVVGPRVYAVYHLI